ncbi:MAG: acyltransferase [Actinomycetota bacterium]
MDTEAAGNTREPSRLDALVAATPASRDRYVDLIRVVSIGVVVLGHWLMAVLGYRGGRFTGENLLEIQPDLQILTWVFQVMPLFFIVGGFTNGTSWVSSRRRGQTYGRWLRMKAVRLTRPALWFVAFWTVLPAAGVATGLLPSSVARAGGQEVALPLWFLAVYLVAVAAVPALHALHDRLGGWTVVALAAAALVVDNLRFGADVPHVGLANYLIVWGAVLELGFLWAEGRLRARAWLPWAMAAGGLAAMAVLVGGFDFPMSMIDLTHGIRNNVQPPSIVLLALAVWQCGVTLLFEGAGNRALARPRAWRDVIAANSMVMTFYLWNMSAVVLAAVLSFPTGIAPQPEPLSRTWWLLRPAWVLVCAACLIPFLLAFRWTERPAPVRDMRSGPAGALVLAVLGTAATAGGLAVLAADAFPVPGEERVVLTGAGVALVAIGSLLLWVDPFAPLRGPRASDA